jgi:hypothetical protein
MKRVILFGFLICITVASFGQADTLLPVKLNNHWGFINTKGQIKIPAVYDAVDPFHHGCMFTRAVKDGKVLIINDLNSIIARSDYDDLHVVNDSFLIVKKNSLWGVFTTKGIQILPVRFQKISFSRNNKYIKFRTPGGTGIADLNGVILIDPVFDSIDIRATGFRTIKGGKEGQYALDGLKILDNRFDSIIGIENRQFLVKMEDFWGVADDSGKMVLNPEWLYPSDLSGYFVKLTRDSRLFLFSTETRKLLFDSSVTDYALLNTSYIKITTDAGLGLINSSGKTIIAPGPYKEFRVFDSLLFEVDGNEYQALVNQSGKWITGKNYSSIGTFNENLALVQGEKGWGIINHRGKEIIPPENEAVQLYSGRAKVKNNNQMRVYEFDDKGNITENTNYTNIITISVKQRTRKRTSDDNENKLLASSLTSVVKEKNGAAWFFDKGKNRWGLKDSFGKVRIKPVFSNVSRIKYTHYFLCQVSTEPFTYSICNYVYRLHNLYCIVSDSCFRMIVPPVFIFIDQSPIKKNGWQYTRAILKNGNFAVIHPDGFDSKESYTYISAIRPGLTRFYKGGKIAEKRASDNTGTLMPEDNFVNATLSTRSALIIQRPFDPKRGQTNYAIAVKGKWGYLDEEGIVKIKPQFDYAENFVFGAAIVSVNNSWGVIDSTGQKVVPVENIEVVRLAGSNDKLFRIKANSPKYGFINTSGQIVTEINYDRVGDYHEGEAWACFHRKYGFIDESFHSTGDTTFSEVRDFSDGLAAIRKGYHWGFIDKNGAIRIPVKLYRVGNFHNGMAWAKADNGRFGYINPEGKWLIKPQFYNAHDFAGNGLAVVETINHFCLIDAHGKEVSANYDFIGSFTEGIAIGRKGKRFYLIDSLGKAYIKLRPCDYVYAFHEGYARIKRRDKYGFIDKSGSIIHKPDLPNATDINEGISVSGFDFKKNVYVLKPDSFRKINKNIISSYSEGLALVCNGDSTFCFIDHRGDDVFGKKFEMAYPFKNGLARVKLKKGWALMDHNGIMVMSPKFNGIGEFSEGRATVKLTGFYGIADLKGNFIAPPDFEYITMLPENIYQLEHGNHLGYLYPNGSWIWKMEE